MAWCWQKGHRGIAHSDLSRIFVEFFAIGRIGLAQITHCCEIVPRAGSTHLTCSSQSRQMARLCVCIRGLRESDTHRRADSGVGYVAQ